MIVRHRFPASFEALDRQFDAFDRSFDRAFEQLTSSFSNARRRAPIVDASWRDGALVLTVDLPGVPADGVSIEVAGRVLTLAVHTDELEWTRSLRLGTTLDPEKISASHVDGRLTVVVGTVDAPTARSISISTTPVEVPPAALEATSSDVDADSADDQPTETSSNG